MQQLTFSGRLLARGFWLYVWEATPASGKPLYYVGRTGDSSSTKAQSPFHRMGQHLGFAETSNMLRRHLLRHGAVPEDCSFRLFALGPLEPESTEESRTEHDRRRDIVASMEKALAEMLSDAGYRVMNIVNCRKELDTVRFKKVQKAFRSVLPRLRGKGRPRGR